MIRESRCIRSAAQPNFACVQNLLEARAQLIMRETVPILPVRPLFGGAMLLDIDETGSPRLALLLLHY